MRRTVLVALLLMVCLGASAQPPKYSIQAIRYGTSPGVNTDGRLHLIDGDNVEIFPGIRAFTGSRHIYDSEYLQVKGTPTYVLASANVCFYLNLEKHLASATFSDADHAANIAQQARMIELAASPDRVVPGHDMLQFEKLPTQGRVATIKAR